LLRAKGKFFVMARGEDVDSDYRRGNRERSEADVAFVLGGKAGEGENASQQKKCVHGPSMCRQIPIKRSVLSAAPKNDKQDAFDRVAVEVDSGRGVGDENSVAEVSRSVSE